MTDERVGQSHSSGERLKEACEKVEAGTAEGERLRLGPAWFLPRPGSSLLYLEGDPFTIGFSNATLTRKLLATQEESLETEDREALRHEPGMSGRGRG